MAALINGGILGPFSPRLVQATLTLVSCTWLKPCRLTRQCERLDRNVVDAKKLKAPSVESHSTPGGHMVGSGRGSHPVNGFFVFFFSLKYGIAMSLTINIIPYIILQIL